MLERFWQKVSKRIYAQAHARASNLAYSVCYDRNVYLRGDKNDALLLLNSVTKETSDS